MSNSSASLDIKSANDAPKKALAVKAKLKWFNPAKGFGFVVPEENPVDAFMHITQFQNLGINGLGDGAVVVCDIDYREKGATVTALIAVLDCGKVPDGIAVPDPANATFFKTKGIVKLYSAEKGFGFISPADGLKDIFIHKLCLSQCGIKELVAGQAVRITFKTAQKGREAVEIEVENTF